MPSSTTAKPGESEALEVLSFILGHGTTSRLYRTLVVERELAVGAGGWYSGTALDATQFGVYGSPKPGVTLPKLEDAIDAVIDDVVAKGVTPDEVERAKNRLIADAIYAQDSQATMARWYGAALTTGSTVEAVQTWPDRIRAVTADAVNAAAKAWLDKRRSVTGYLIKDVATRGKANVIRRLRFLIAFAAAADRRAAAPQPAGATTVQRVVSPGGIEAWLVQEPSLPLVALNFAFIGGATEDPTDKPGVGYMVSSLLDDGAGELDAKAFQQQARGQCRRAALLGHAGLFLPARSACCATARSRASTCCGSRSTSRASMPMRSAACASRSWPGCAARPPIRAASPTGRGGAPHFQAIPTAVRPAAR